MQKVVGSSPIIRLEKGPGNRAFCFLGRTSSSVKIYDSRRTRRPHGRGGRTHTRRLGRDRKTTNPRRQEVSNPHPHTTEYWQQAEGETAEAMAMMRVAVARLSFQIGKQGTRAYFKRCMDADGTTYRTLGEGVATSAVDLPEEREYQRKVEEARAHS
jgi:hypothetical protein